MQKSPETPFSSFLYAALAGHLTYAMPAMTAILLFDLMEATPLFWIVGPIASVSIPLSAALTWLMAKGSNWVNTATALMTACILPARFYGVLLGGLLGFHFFKTVGGIVGVLLGYVVARAASIPVGKFTTHRILLATQSTKA